MPPKLTFLYLKAFQITGGIEKMNRVLLKALWDLQQQGSLKVLAASPYSSGENADYFPEDQLLAFHGRRWLFMLRMLFNPPKTDVLLLGHINLAPVALFFRFRYPQMKIILLAHGIEVWRPLSGFKKWISRGADLIISVSEFTKSKLLDLHVLDPKKIKVLPNCLDPYFQLPTEFHKPDYLLQRYGLHPEQKVLLTISRINKYEGYKGYDQVLKCIPQLVKLYPDLKYILAGNCEPIEKLRLEALIQSLGIEKFVHLPGFVPETELTDHYRLADVFVMPSKKEGFGIVFIEAMACGTPAVGGDQDGSPEALRPGLLGVTTDPDDLEDIVRTIKQVLRKPKDPPSLQTKTAMTFGYDLYRDRLEMVIKHTLPTLCCYAAIIAPQQVYCP